MNRFFGNLLGALVQVGLSELQRKAQKQGKIILPNDVEVLAQPEQKPVRPAKQRLINR